MNLDWIPHELKCGSARVYCKTCETICEYNRAAKVYDCKCDFGASIEALAFGLKGYEWSVADDD